MLRGGLVWRRRRRVGVLVYQQFALGLQSVGQVVVTHRWEGDLCSVQDVVKLLPSEDRDYLRVNFMLYVRGLILRSQIKVIMGASQLT